MFNNLLLDLNYKIVKWMEMLYREYLVESLHLNKILQRTLIFLLSLRAFICNYVFNIHDNIII